MLFPGAEQQLVDAQRNFEAAHKAYRQAAAERSMAVAIVQQKSNMQEIADVIGVKKSTVQHILLRGRRLLVEQRRSD